MHNSNSVDDRSEFLAFLGERGVGGVAHHPHRELFVLGDGDVLFSELSVDSLALMEIGIGLEEQYGVSLSPNELGRFLSVEALWLAVGGETSPDLT